ncbi:MAG TPA: hypothetical protein VFC94_01970 [Bacteroidaceae bacterium]|nr:hypothetical protein [Bacteroidaceae bacterium]
MKKTRERLIFATLFCIAAIIGCRIESIESLTVSRFVNSQSIKD